MSATELASAIKAKKLSPVEAVDAILKRIERINPKINAFVTLLADEARDAAKKAEQEIYEGKYLGPLHGIPVSIKDNTFTQGVRTTFGSKLYKDFIPDEDCAFVERLKKAGAIIIGKTNLPEFGLIATTDNPVFGPTKNPWNMAKTPGGSSGGGAAAAAAGLGPLHHGNDGGGSIRIPSSFSGVYGLKPQFGRVPRFPALHGWETLSGEGTITRTVEDAALLLTTMAGPDDRDRYSLPAQNMGLMETLKEDIKGLKIAWSPTLGYATVDPDVLEITKRAALKFQGFGCEVDEISQSLMNIEYDWLVIVASETVTALEDKRQEWEKIMYPHYKPFIPLADALKARDFALAQFHREDHWREARKIFETYDILLTPTTPVTAFDIGIMGPEKIDGKDVAPTAIAAFTIPFNFSGQPAATIPCGFTREGLPVGLQIIGRRFDEATVIRASAAFERAFPWADKRPYLE
ncbi:MAG: amidase [Deltaproteobacteria bacterium]|nr:amidase [Deltaproteobacteria bacterium]